MAENLVKHKNDDANATIVYKTGAYSIPMSHDTLPDLNGKQIAISQYTCALFDRIKR